MKKILALLVLAGVSVSASAYRATSYAEYVAEYGPPSAHTCKHMAAVVPVAARLRDSGVSLDAALDGFAKYDNDAHLLMEWGMVDQDTVIKVYRYEYGDEELERNILHNCANLQIYGYD